MSYRHCSAPRLRGQSGAALIIALMVFALAAALMVGLQRDFALQLQRSSNALLMEQGWAYLRGAEELAATALRYDADQDALREAPRDDLTELWATQATPYALGEGGWLMGQLEDLQGRFNLNNLVVSTDVNDPADAADRGDASDPGSDEGGDDTDETPTSGGATTDGEPSRFTPAQVQFIRLLQSLEGMPVPQTQAIALTEAISDFIDRDEQRRLEGAEAEAYRNATPSYLPANQPLASVSELRSVQGMTPDLYQALAPYVTVWPQEGGKINVLTAPLPIIRSLNVDGLQEPLSAMDGQRLIELRAAGDMQGIDDFLADFVFAGGEVGQLRESLATNSEWFLLNASVEIADRELRLYSVLQRDGRAIKSRYRSQGEL